MSARTWLPPILAAFLLLAACACQARPPAGVDTWSTRRLSLHGQPHLRSHSQVNPGRPTAALPAMHPLLRRDAGAHRIEVHAADTLADAWRAATPVLQPEADRALRWLASLAPDDSRPRLLVLRLVDRDARYELRQTHAAGERLRLELLVPVDRHPPSHGAALAQGLALGLHEASHALRPAGARDRGDDEYRASLLAACYLIDGLQRGDRMRLLAPPSVAGDFTLAHSQQARARTIDGLRQAVGGTQVDGGDARARDVLLRHCNGRLAQPAR